MTAPTELDVWNKLKRHHQQVAGQRIESFFDLEPGRERNFNIAAAGLTLDYSKNFLDETGLNLLLELAGESGLADAIEALFRGDKVNASEDRPALHTALRNQGDDVPAVQSAIKDCQHSMGLLVEKLHQGRWQGASGEPITDIINIGIGGSDLGPAMACQALRPYDQKRQRVHFVSNLDGAHIAENIEGLNPFTTLFIVASKSFTTLETRKNAESARDWLRNAGIDQDGLKHHFIAVSANVQAAKEFGIAEENILPMWDWVGGRYSVWSAVGLALAAQIGMDHFNDFLAGGAAMDQHFRTAEFRNNMPVILALVSIWYINFFNAEARVVVPYSQHLGKFPSYLQQLEMESIGKSVQRDGKPVDYQTMGAIFGEAGSNTQHSFHQLLLQGTRLFPVDFIAAARSHYPISDHHTLLLANCIAQSRALMTGRNLEAVTAELEKQGLDIDTIKTLAPQKVIEGNKPSNILAMDLLTPATLGALIALHEHKVYVQSVIWNINAFDQWAVELGKQLSTDVYQSLVGDDEEHFDPSTNTLIAWMRQHSK
ncbi:MAG: glucose-6-phosphate isomerase [Acidiferrobacterales bacterium]|nr:glucose-6-phosphate isomerase [Acidiferrobacterales bacterium]